MLGGGVFVTQNKTLPGSYINLVNASKVSSTVSDRGVVAIVLDTNSWTGVKEITKAQFHANCKDLFGCDYTDDTMLPLREIFCHSNKVLVYATKGETDAYDKALNAFEAYEFNVLCPYDFNAEGVSAAITKVKGWRDDMGKKCQVVVVGDDLKADHEGVIQVVSTVSGEKGTDWDLAAWVAGAEAGCKVNESCTNMLYDGELEVVTDKTQAELEACITNGQVAFHLVYGDIRLLEDINSLTTVTADKGEDFKSNQTIRVIDQIANDIAKLFNTKYLGRIPNNESGRTSLWADIVAHHKNLEAISAIEPFDSNLLTVEQGATKKSVVINDCITVVNAMAQLYMTVVVQ
jgi:hypothetical protein